MRNEKELAEMPRGDLVKLAMNQGKNLAAKGKDIAKSKSHMARGISRRVGTVLAAGQVLGLEYCFKNTSPRLVKYSQAGLALAGMAGGVVADVLGAEPLAGALDGAAATNLGAFLVHAVKGRAAGGAQGPANNNAPASAGDTGDMWQGNTLPFDGTGAQPAPAAPSGNRQAPNRPLLALARRDGRFLKGLRYGLARRGYEPSAANVGAILEAADSVVGEDIAVDPNTGEFVSLLDTSGTGAVSPLAVALEALRKLGPLMTSLDALPQEPANVAQTQGPLLSDDELALAAAAGLVDPEDAAHVMTSGMDDGIYLSAAGGEVTAADVREDMENWDTGAISDRWQAYKTRRAYAKGQKERRKTRRLESKQKRQQLKEERKAANQEARLDRKEARETRSTTQTTNRLTAQNTAEAETQAALEQQGKDLAESSLPADAASADNAATDDSSSDSWNEDAWK